MIKNILIIEDKKAHLEALCKIVTDLNMNIEVYTASNVETAYQLALEYHIHLFLVDIILNPEKTGNVDGLKFAQEMREIKRYMFTPLIFITSLEDPKLYTYSQLHCFGYIEKPFSVEKVRKLIIKALQFPDDQDEERFVYFRKDGIVYSRNVKEIIYIESSRRKILVHCKNDSLEIPYKTCSEILKELDSKSFVQCSRYAIINKIYVEQIDYTNRFVKLQNIDNLIEIGVTMKKSFKEAMKER